jgi:hypothetical protein
MPSKLRNNIICVYLAWFVDNEPRLAMVRLGRKRSWTLDDPTLAINWPVSSENAVLSEKDRKFGSFADLVSPFRYHHS